MHSRINIGETNKKWMRVTVASDVADLGLVRGEDYTKERCTFR
jgi:hypothetical protein